MGGGKELLSIIVPVVVVFVVVLVRCSQAVLNILVLVSLTGIKPIPHYAEVIENTVSLRKRIDMKCLQYKLH